MKTTPKERAEVIHRLGRLGIEYQDAERLRRCAMTLRNWFELECGTGNATHTWSIERECGTDDGKPLMRVQYMGHDNKWVDQSRPVADREKGARKRLNGTMKAYPQLLVYVQTDPRGASLYILRKSDVNGSAIEQVYNRGVAVY